MQDEFQKETYKEVDLLPLLRATIQDQSLWSGLIIMLCRAVPLAQHDIEGMRIKSWLKEMNGCETTRKDDHVDFNVLFDPTRHHETMHPGLSPNSYMMKYFYIKLTIWRRWVSTVTHYPRANNKYMSHRLKDDFENTFGIRFPLPGLSQRDYLYVEAMDRYSLQGPTEMRQTWTRSNFKPRTYYAQGGVYGRTSCLQNAFSEMVNITPITNHVTRLRPTRIVCRPGGYFRIYDLTTFTTMMWSQADFIDALAEFCSGHPITMMTAKDGLITRDLGEVLSEYNDETNRMPTVTYYRCKYLDEEGRYDTYQQYAGMLGLYGNLMTCTFAHGVIVSTLCHHEDELNVAGDDGIVPEDETTMIAVKEAISVVGIHEESKEFISTQPGSIHLKRPIKQPVNQVRVETKYMVIWPDASLLEELIVGAKDPRYTRHESLTMFDRVSLVGRELLRFLRSIFIYGQILPAELEVVVEFLQLVKNALENHMNRRLQPSLTQCGDEFFWPWLPSIEDTEVGDPWIQTVNHRYCGSVVTTQLGYMPWSGDAWMLQVGETFQANDNKYLQFLYNCKLIEKRAVKTMLSGEAGLDYLYRTWDRSFEEPLVYEYEVLCDVPDHLREY